MTFHSIHSKSTVIHSKSTLSKTPRSASTTTLPYWGVGCGGGRGGPVFYGCKDSTLIHTEVAI